MGIEPMTYALPRRCSTSELLGPARRHGTNRLAEPLVGGGEVSAAVDDLGGPLVQFDLT